jgi:hypothetical protein
MYSHLYCRTGFQIQPFLTFRMCRYSALTTTTRLIAWSLRARTFWYACCLLGDFNDQFEVIFHLTLLYCAFLSNARSHKTSTVALWQNCLQLFYVMTHCFDVYLTRLNAPEAGHIACWGSGYNRSEVAQQVAVFCTIRLFCGALEETTLYNSVTKILQRSRSFLNILGDVRWHYSVHTEGPQI